MAGLSAALFTALALLAVEINAAWMASLDASVYNWFCRHRFHELRIDSQGLFALIGQPIPFAAAGVTSGTLLAVITRAPANLAELHDGSLLDYAHSFPSGHVTAVSTLLGMIACVPGRDAARR